MRIVRMILAPILLFLNWITTPRGVKRPTDLQQQVDQQTAGLSLYQFKACPFCIKVRRTFKRHSLKVETRDAKHDETVRQELLEQGGKIKVPCLRIEEAGEVSWMYDSNAIVEYLQGRFANQA
ncbi:MAG: glutathione S-transferase N-terminal domain-containing protein [Pseudomonadales bacterium]